jgi:hypothetical protein
MIQNCGWELVKAVLRSTHTALIVFGTSTLLKLLFDFNNICYCVVRGDVFIIINLSTIPLQSIPSGKQDKSSKS